jgi:hypothetical protein
VWIGVEGLTSAREGVCWAPAYRPTAGAAQGDAGNHERDAETLSAVKIWVRTASPVTVAVAGRRETMSA